ncbi:MAG: glycoside hydrolase family 36 protein [Nitrososphaerales archaeon]
MKKLIGQFELGDITAAYVTDDQRVGLLLSPTDLLDGVAWDKEYAVNSLLQAKVAGDAFGGGISNGLTMRNSETVARLQYVDQQVVEADGATTISTSFATGDGQRAIHRLVYRPGCPALTSSVAYTNASREAVGLEMVASFSFGAITPFAAGDTPRTLRVHRLRARWSSEGRLESLPAEDLMLIPSWARYDQYSEKFGQVGSKPVNRWHPFVAVEDVERGVMWGVQLAAPASWQIELYNQDDALWLSGGLADFDFGHWLKRLKPGDTFTTGDAYLTVCHGDLDTLCHRLVSAQELSLQDASAEEEDLPIQFNEWATTWGSPTHESLTGLAECLQGRGVKYLIIDAGWYKKPGIPWDNCAGDWEISRDLFPDGLKATADALRAAGLVPGIWFEFEVAGRDADAFCDTEHLLKRMGQPLTSGVRRFWDFRQAWVREHLHEKVVGLLKECGFGYLKIDYNETIGVGCDGAESLGEGLRGQIEAVQDFVRSIRRELPDIVIENCSSGSQRAEPSWTALTSVTSFSDTHECSQIPIIAANMHRVILPRQNLVWCVVRPHDDEKRLRYSLAATLLGRMCLSGDIALLSDAGQRLVDEAIAFYRKAVTVIKQGFSRRYGPPVLNYAHPCGWQAMVRTNEEQVLVVIHTFGGDPPSVIELPLPGPCIVVAAFAGTTAHLARDGIFQYRPSESFEGAAFLLRSIRSQA